MKSTLMVVLVVFVVIIILQSIRYLIKRSVAKIYDNTYEVEAKIQEIDSSFKADDFIGMAQRVFFSVINCLAYKNVGNLQELKTIETVSLFEKHKEQVIEHTEEKWLIRGLICEQINLKSYIRIEETEYVDVYILAKVRMQLEDTKVDKNEEIDSDVHNDLVSYILTFKRVASQDWLLDNLKEL